MESRQSLRQLRGKRSRSLQRGWPYAKATFMQLLYYCLPFPFLRCIVDNPILFSLHQCFAELGKTSWPQRVMITKLSEQCQYSTNFSQVSHGVWGAEIAPNSRADWSWRRLGRRLQRHISCEWHRCLHDLGEIWGKVCAVRETDMGYSGTCPRVERHIWVRVWTCFILRNTYWFCIENRAHTILAFHLSDGS